MTRPQDTEYSYHLTRSDIMLPHIADYLHGLNCSLDWIPYYGSRGYDAWRSFGFDQVYLQPNYYWKPQNDMDDVFRRIGELGVGLELEFEPTLLAGREGSEAFRERFRAYMRHAKETGVYGSRPIAYYHGTNGFYDLWASPDAEDREPVPRALPFHRRKSAARGGPSDRRIPADSGKQGKRLTMNMIRKSILAALLLAAA